MPKVFRSLKLKVFTSDLKSWENFTMYPPEGKLWASSHQLHVEASNFVYELEKEFPGNIFQLVKKGTNKYNVVPMSVTPKTRICECLISLREC